jgi:outer membrane protein insertion porin family
VDVNMTVVEKPTGVLLFGVGFGSGEGLLLSGSISQNNIFGSGRHVSLAVNSSKINTNYSLSYTDPYYTVDGVSRGFDVYYRTLNPANYNLARYQTKTVGGQLRMGVPVTEIDTINYGIGYESVDIVTFVDSPLIYRDYVATFGPTNSNLYVTAGWARDGRDSLIYPTKGTLHKAGVEVGLPGGDLEYYKAYYQYQQYFPLTRYWTLMLNGEAGQGDGYGNKPLPFFKNFFAGGVNSVRGFRSYTIGPKDSDTNPRGGTYRLLGNAELLFPFPGLENDRSVRMGAFFDAAMVGDGKIQSGDLRYSTGLSLLWASPMGPLKISIGVPLHKQPLDKSQFFQFTLGGVF